MHIRLINPNTTASMTEKIGAAGARVAAAGTRISATNPVAGPVSIESHFDEAISAVGVIEARAGAQVAGAQTVRGRHETFQTLQYRVFTHEPGRRQGQRRGQGQGNEIPDHRPPGRGQGLAFGLPEADHETLQRGVREIQTLEAVEPPHAVHPPFQEGPFLLFAGHAFDHAGEVAHPCVLLGFREPRQAQPVMVRQGEDRAFWQMEVDEYLTKVAQVEGGHQDAARRAVAIDDSEADMAHV